MFSDGWIRYASMPLREMITPGIPQISPAARYLSSLSDLFLVIFKITKKS